MKQKSLFVALMLLCMTAIAAPVDLQKARLAGIHHLQREGLIKASDTLTLALTQQYSDPTSEPITTYYIFNIGERGFVMVSADDRCTPILGYSMNGSYDPSRMPTNFMGWIEQYSSDIAQGIRSNLPASKETLAEWEEELKGDFVIPSAPKADEYLVQSTWEQGTGYNNYCPMFNGQHAVVGCVATAMAQIIRYYQFPTRGFGQKSYSHNYYGQLAINFDTSEYNYSLMPLHVNYWSASSAETDMVSSLCYHCGVSVNMNYENPNYTEGSGSYTSRVPDALIHFGYVGAEHYARTNVNDDTRWINMIKAEIDNRRPIEYSGHGTSGGHAFVLDGYKTNNKYHFNWGWGGYGDGFYTLTTMQGFVNSHEMVVNIYPSGLDGHAQRFYISPDGTGNGTSWEEANSNISAAVALNTMGQRDIWMKEGTYYGSTTSDYAYKFNGSATITGGFAGTESAANERNPELHPTIIDGQNARPLLSLTNNNSSTRTLKMSDIVLKNGYTPNGACLLVKGNAVASFFTITDCQSDSGCVVALNESLMRMSIIKGNNSHEICQMNSSALRQSLICNNNSDIVLKLIDNGSRVANTNIVSNQGIGVNFMCARTSFVNNIVWNNDTSMVNPYSLNDTSIRNCAIESDTDFVDSTWIRLGHDNELVRFISPNSRGIEGISENDDWHLANHSVCIDKGERVSACITDGDLDRGIRCRNGIIDLGCYETNYPVSIDQAESTTIRIYPNPATSTIAMLGCEGEEATLYDMSGRAVMQFRCNGSIDISQLSAGIYYLRCQGRTEKLVKQ